MTVPGAFMSKRPHRLFTAQLTLEQAVSSDFWRVWDIWSEPDIARQVFSQPAPSLKAALEAFESWQAGSGEGLGLWIIRSTLGDHALGCVSLARRLFANPGGTQLCGPVEFQIAMQPGARGRGLAHEAARAVIRHAFSNAELAFMAASSDASDAAVNGLLARIGFRNTSEHFGPEGRRLGHVMTRSDFAEALTAPAPLR